MTHPTAVGIDLGTTFSLAAYVENGRPVVVRDAGGVALVPSVISFHEDGSVTFLDFGLVKRWAPGEFDRLGPLLDAILDEDPQALVDRAVHARFLAADHGFDPDFVFEYDNVQDGGNHVHSVWRNKSEDFGANLLGEHYRLSHARSE